MLFYVTETDTVLFSHVLLLRCAGHLTFDPMLQAVKADIVRSLTSRCQLLCEDLLQTEEDQGQ